MAKDPAFLFYTNDFMSGTQFFTDEQLGQYLRLLMAQHQHGHLTEKQVKFICKSYDKDILIKFEIDDSGLYFNRRLEEEIFKRKRFTESRSNNKSGRKKLINNELNENEYDNHILITRKSYDLHMENENENINRIKKDKIIHDFDFDFFWNDYDKKIGDKEKIKKKWIALKQEERDLIFLHIPKYKESQPDKQFRKNPETYLNNKSWLDEIIIKDVPRINVQTPIISKTESLIKKNNEAKQIINDFFKNSDNEQQWSY